MPVPTAITDLSQTAASNFPAGSNAPSVLDDVQRAHAGFIATLRDGKGFTTPVVLASAGTTDIGAQNAMGVEISGTTTITSFGTSYNGPRFLRFTGALTLTHNASSLILPGAANISVQAGDCLVVMPKTTAGVADGWQVAVFQPAAPVARPLGYIYGLTLSNNVSDATNDIDISAGQATDTTGAFTLTLASTMTKRLDAAWTAGTGNGGLDAGSIANAEYNVWEIRKDSDGSIDVLFSISPTAPTMPAGYTAKRRIGSFFRASGVIRPFIQKGDRFYYKTLPLDVDATLGTAATSYTISVPGGAVAILNVFAQRSNPDSSVYVYSPEITDQAISTTVSPLSNLIVGAAGVVVTYMGTQIEVLTNATSQIRAVSGAASTTFKAATVGYIDRRGKDA